MENKNILLEKKIKAISLSFGDERREKMVSISFQDDSLVETTTDEILEALRADKISKENVYSLSAVFSRG